MFNQYLITSQSPAVHVHNKIEQKTHDAADAARLYGQLKEKAEREVAEATVTRFGADNELTAVVIHTQYDIARDIPLARILFRLNGSLYDLELKPDANDIRDCLYQAVAEKLVLEIMTEISKRGGMIR